MMRRDEERIVVTGMGCASVLGHDVEQATNNLWAGKDGIGPMPPDIADNFGQLRCKVAAPITDFSLEADGLLHYSEKDVLRLHRTARFSLWASAQAMRQAGLVEDDMPTLRDNALVDADRIGISIGTGVGGTEQIGHALEVMKVGRKLSTRAIMNILPERVATTVAMRFGARGPVQEVTGACATGNLAIMAAADMLKLNRADVMIVGGSEAQITPAGIGLFDTLGALDSSPDPGSASRPFHRDAKGFVMGEGAGVLVLETLAHAKRRGAVALAELVGYGHTSDAYHDTMPSGEGAARALRIALAGVEGQGIYINAHATGTKGDAKELEAIGQVLKPDQVVGISSTKGATGHMLGAAGAFEAIVTIRSLRESMIPPSLKLDEPIAEAEGWPMSPLRATTAHIDLGVNNSFGFGGINAVTVWGRVAD